MKRPQAPERNLDLSRLFKPISNVILLHKDGWKRQDLHRLHTEDALSLSVSEMYERISTINTLGIRAQSVPAICKTR